MFLMLADHCMQSAPQKASSSIMAMKLAATSFVVASAIDLVTFDDAKNWNEENDPVMGGKSVATATVENGHGILDGEVVNVPALSAPGFVQAQAELRLDASEAAGGDLVMKVRSSTPEYAGFKMAFAASSLLGLGCKGPSSRGCYKAPFTVPAGDDFTEVRIPLSEFSDKWNSATGELTTLCKDDPSVCPSADKLKKVQRLAVWGEGVAGKLHIEFDSISLEPAQARGTLSLSTHTTGRVPMTTFDGASETTQRWMAVNDPVMGGKSKATFSLDSDNNVGVFDGAVAIVPSLSAPGFCSLKTSGVSFPDISGADALEIVARSSVAYKGWRLEFGPAPKSMSPFIPGSYKANFDVEVSDEFQTVTVPFSDFTYKWSDTTGEPVVKCSDDPSVCPEESYLKAPKLLEIIAEGVEGQFHLEVKSISAVKMANTHVVQV